jgi:HSP20 family protein
MNIIRREFDTPIHAMNRLMSQLWNEDLTNGGIEAVQQALLPLDVLEDERNVIVKASLPGFRPEDVDVQVHNGILSIKAEHSEESEDSGERFLRRERRFGSVSRSVALPSMVDEDACEASLENGVLTLRIPKSQEAMPRKVKIGAGQPPRGASRPAPAKGGSPAA